MTPATKSMTLRNELAQKPVDVDQTDKVWSGLEVEGVFLERTHEASSQSGCTVVATGHVRRQRLVKSPEKYSDAPSRVRTSTYCCQKINQSNWMNALNVLVVSVRSRMALQRQDKVEQMEMQYCLSFVLHPLCCRADWVPWRCPETNMWLKRILRCVIGVTSSKESSRDDTSGGCVTNHGYGRIEHGTHWELKHSANERPKPTVRPSLAAGTWKWNGTKRQDVEIPLHTGRTSCCCCMVWHEAWSNLMYEHKCRWMHGPVSCKDQCHRHVSRLHSFWKCLHSVCAVQVSESECLHSLFDHFQVSLSLRCRLLYCLPVHESRSCKTATERNKAKQQLVMKSAWQTGERLGWSQISTQVERNNLRACWKHTHLCICTSEYMHKYNTPSDTKQVANWKLNSVVKLAWMRGMGAMVSMTMYMYKCM